MPSVEQTIAFIREAHKGQTDKAGKPYWRHPVSVMERLGEDAPEAEKLVALLHDVIEDTPHTADDLLSMGYSEEVVEAVQLHSRPDGLTYIEWIHTLAMSGSRIAIRVKIADNEDNADPDRLAELPQDKRKIAGRYHESLRILRTALYAEGDR